MKAYRLSIYSLTGSSRPCAASGCFTPSHCRDQIAEGETPPIALAAQTRSLLFPAIPTFGELDHDVAFGSWSGLTGPVGMNPEIVQTIHDTVEAIMKMEWLSAQRVQFSIS